jgi:CubicO group peptidase (beta-lactamase class C family)
LTPEELSRLDRHRRSVQPSPDVASLAELMAADGIPGVAVAAGTLADGVWSAGYGTIGAGRPEPVTGTTVFQACSISKHVAAFGALRLVADGTLSLDADIRDYLSSWQLSDSDGWRPRVTPRQLLAHTAGLSYNWFPGYGAGAAVPSLRQILDGEPPATTPPVRATLLPGSQFRYSGSHYAVLQQLMTDVTGTPFAELLDALVLGPAGMADSSYRQQFPAGRPGGAALGHHGTGTPVPGGWRTQPELAAAGLWTTPADLVRLELEIIRAAAGESRLLPAELAGQMLTAQVPGGMGLGTWADTSAGYLRFGHPGRNTGYSCLSSAWPATGAAFAMMTNNDDAGEVLATSVAAAERRYAPPPDAAAPAPGEVAGRYLLRDDYPVDIRADGGGLTLTAPGQEPAKLAGRPGGRWRLPGLDAEITFETAGTGPDAEPTLRLRQGGGTQSAARRPGPGRDAPVRRPGAGR